MSNQSEQVIPNTARERAGTTIQSNKFSSKINQSLNNKGPQVPNGKKAEEGQTEAKPTDKPVAASEVKKPGLKRLDTAKVTQTPKNAEAKQNGSFNFANNFAGKKQTLHPIRQTTKSTLGNNQTNVVNNVNQSAPTIKPAALASKSQLSQPTAPTSKPLPNPPPAPHVRPQLNPSAIAQEVKPKKEPPATVL